MEIIEFRGKDKDTGEWITGGYHKHIARQVCPMGDKLNEDDIEHLIIVDGFADWNMPIPIKCHTVIPETVGEFTRMQDKHETKVYVGDLVKDYDGEVGEITYSLLDCAYVVRFSRCESELGLYLNTDIEVIGNKWDNPELLNYLSLEI